MKIVNMAPRGEDDIGFMCNPVISLRSKGLYMYFKAMGGVEPDVATVCEHLNINFGTYYRALRELRELGLVEVEKVRDKGQFNQSIIKLLGGNMNAKQ